MVDVVFNAAAREGDVEQLTKQRSRADDVAGVSGGQALSAVDGAGVPEGDVVFDVAGGQVHHPAGAQVLGVDCAVVECFDDLEAVPVADEVGAAQPQMPRVFAGPNDVTG